MRIGKGKGSSFRWWLIAAGVALVSPSVRAAFEMPRQVPVAKLSQQVGLTEISLEYECPAVKGRKIFGGVVPFDRVWTFGTGAAPRVRFNREVTVGDKAVPAGTYSLLALPGRATWTVILNKSSAPITSVGDYRPDHDVARIKVPAKSIARRERLIFLFSELADDRAALDLEWDEVRVSIPVRVNTTEQVLSAIGDLDDAWRSFANAARYMLEVKKDYDAGLKYIDQSLALREDWYSLWVKAALLAGKGRFADANQVAERAYDLERKVGNGTALEAELRNAIAEWRSKGRLPDPPTARDADTKRAEKEQPPVEAKTVADAKAEDKVELKAPASPPAFAPAATSTPAAEAPALRRARLRRR